MPAKGGHLDLTDEDSQDCPGSNRFGPKLRRKESPTTASREGYFKERFGPVVSTAIETEPVVSWPPAESASERAKRLYQREKKLLAQLQEVGGKDYEGMGLEDLSQLKSKDLSRPSDQVQGTSTNSPKNENPTLAIDDQPATKYLNFDGAGSGLELKIKNSVVNGISITSANDAPERDPKKVSS